MISECLTCPTLIDGRDSGWQKADWALEEGQHRVHLHGGGGGGHHGEGLGLDHHCVDAS